MLSHAWGGAVVETYSAIQSLLSLHMLPSNTTVFFCTLCIYQPEDGAPNGLSIAAQLEQAPFAKVTSHASVHLMAFMSRSSDGNALAQIIASRPKHGMCVLNTTSVEVYDRMWCVHEVDEAIEAGVGTRQV